MATRTHGVFINTIGLLYGSLGFSLSVLAALIGIVIQFISPPRARSLHVRPHLPRKLRGPRTVRSFDQSRKIIVPGPPEYLPVAKECRSDVKSLRRRSKSLVPIITIDQFESANTPEFLNFLPKSALPVATSWPNPASIDSAAMNLSTMSRPRIQRRSSSPLVLSHPTPLPLEGSKSSFIKISLARRGKTPSAADLNQEKLTMRFDASYFRKAGKKKSLTRRTQPYGAPYFCTPPYPTASPDNDIRK